MTPQGLRSSTEQGSQAVLLPCPLPHALGTSVERKEPRASAAKGVQSLRDRGIGVILSLRTEWQLGHRGQPRLPASFWSHKLKWPQMLWPGSAGLLPLTGPTGPSGSQTASAPALHPPEGPKRTEAEGPLRDKARLRAKHVSWSRSQSPLRRAGPQAAALRVAARSAPDALCGSLFPSG